MRASAAMTVTAAGPWCVNSRSNCKLFYFLYTDTGNAVEEGIRKALLQKLKTE
jgi:hypothetical protein